MFVKNYNFYSDIIIGVDNFNHLRNNIVFQ